jgi:hypothetical protein
LSPFYQKCPIALVNFRPIGGCRILFFIRKRNLIAFSGACAEGCERRFGGICSAKEIPQHFVDGIGKLDLGKVAG